MKQKNNSRFGNNIEQMIPTLKDCMEYEETGIIDLAELKVKCFEFAIQITKHGIYSPDEVMQEAKKIFDWCMKNEIMIRAKVFHSIACCVAILSSFGNTMQQ